MTPHYDLADVLDYLGVRYRTGRREVKILCPVHGDRDPSMNANLEQGLLKCHACGWGGNATQLLMEVEGVDLDGARKIAAQNGFGTCEAGDSGTDVQSDLFPPRRLSKRKGHRGGGAKWVPPWEC